MLRSRVLVALVLLPVGLVAVFMGGWPYFVLIAGLVGAAAYEYVDLMRAGELHPARWLVVGGTLALLLARFLGEYWGSAELLTMLILGSLTYHLVAFERGRKYAGTDFGVSLGGIFYFGWIGAYLFSLRALPDGQWWLLVALAGVWVADSAAYFVGSRFGRHKLSPRLSPKKSWEGYLAGLVFGPLGNALLALLWGALGAGPEITPLRAALLALLLAAVTPLGDLGESMFKRQVGVKDSGTLFPGHGGAFDRIDSWLWAAVLGYYLITWLFLGG